MTRIIRISVFECGVSEQVYDLWEVKVAALWDRLAKLRGYRSVKDAWGAQPEYALLVVVERPSLEGFLEALEHFIPRIKNKELWWRSWDKTVVVAGKCVYGCLRYSGFAFFGPEKQEKVRKMAARFRFFEGKRLPISSYISSWREGDITFLLDGDLVISFPKLLVQLVHGFFGFYYLTGRWGRLGVKTVDRDTLLSLMEYFPDVFPRIDGGRVELEPGRLVGVVTEKERASLTD